MRTRNATSLCLDLNSCLAPDRDLHVDLDLISSSRRLDPGPSPSPQLRFLPPQVVLQDLVCIVLPAVPRSASHSPLAFLKSIIS